MRHASGRVGLSRRTIAGILASTLVLVASACTLRHGDKPQPLPGVESTAQDETNEDGDRSVEQGDVPGPTGSGDEDARSGPDDKDAAGDVTAGPGGEPWDPCQIITWDDLPGEQPSASADAEPEPHAGEADDAYTTACRFPAKTNDVVVLWGPSDRATIKPSGAHGEEQTHVASRPALKIVSLSEQLTLICMVKVDLGANRGVAGVGAFARSTQQTASNKHPCVVALRLAAEVVKRTR